MNHSLKIKHSKLSQLAVLGILLMSQLSWAAIEPRIVGGVESNPNERGFMASLFMLDPFVQGDEVSLSIGKTGFKGKLISASNEIPVLKGAKGTQYRGLIYAELVDCGLAESPCEGVSGKACVIQDGGNTLNQKVQNCEAGGGLAAIIYADQTQGIDGSAASASAAIPAVGLSARQGDAFLKSIGKKIVAQVINGTKCGGTLIRKDWIVTAAHCVMQNDKQGNPVEPYPPEQIKVILGGHEVPIEVSETPEILVPFVVSKEELSVRKAFAHRDFSNGFKSDIALIQLASPAKAGQPLSIIDGPSLATAIDSGSSVSIIGRGEQEPLKEGEENSSTATITKLYEVELPLVSTQTCQEIVKQKSPGYQLTDGDFCVGGTPEGGKDACHGDSGGPIVMRKDNGELSLVGAVSRGISGCAQPNVPSLHTRIPAYASEIEDIISGRSDELKGAPAEPTAVLSGTGSSDDTDAKKGGGGGGAVNFLWGLVLMLFRNRQIRIRTRCVSLAQ